VNPPPPPQHFLVPAAGTATTAVRDIVLDTDVYKTALEILSGKRFGCPNLDTLRTHLDTFVGQPTTAFFKVGSVLAKRFNNFKKDLRSSFKSASAKREVWAKIYIAPRLSLLLSLRHLREEEKKGEALAARGKSALGKAFAALYKMYEPCYQSFKANDELETNKKNRMPTSLRLNENTARPHEHIQWDPTRKLQFPCPTCSHVSTSLFRVDDANADAMGAERVKAAAAISPLSDTGCFCFRINCNGKLNGSGCYLCEGKARDNVPPVSNTPGVCKWGCPICLCHCACTFAENNQMAIALRWRKLKEQESKVAAKNLPASGQQQGGDTTLMSIINNRIKEAMDGGMASNSRNISWAGLASDDDDNRLLEAEEDESDDDDFYGRKKKGKLDTALAKASLDILNSREYDYACRHLLQVFVNC